MKIALQFAMPSELHALPGCPGAAAAGDPSPAFPYLRLPRTFWPVPAASAR